MSNAQTEHILNIENIDQRIQIDLTADNQLEFIHFTQQHIEALDPIRACHIYASIHEKLNNSRALVDSLDRGMRLSQQHFSQQRDLRDAAVSVFWFQKIELLHRRADADPSELLDTLDRGLDKFLAQNPAQYLVLADIADRHQAYLLLERILIKLIYLQPEPSPVLQGLMKYYVRCQQILREGHDTVEMRRFQILMQMVYTQELNLEPITFYHSSLECIHAFPTSAVGYHFAGIYLAGKGEFERALDYLKRALKIKVDVVTWRCWIESRYCLGHEPDLQVPVFSDDLPVILFTESYHFEDFIVREVRDQDQQGWFEMSCELYRQAYAAYRDYQLSDRFASVNDADRENLGKCCDNYAMRLNQLEKYRLAVQVATEGLSLSGFVGLHVTRMNALMLLQDVQAADQALTEYFGNYRAEDVPFLQHQAHLASQLRVDFELGRLQGLEDKAHAQLMRLYQFQTQQRKKHKKQYKTSQSNVQQRFTEQDRLLDHLLGHIEHTIDDLMLKHDIQKRIAYYENIVLEHAQLATPYYMLMYDYHTLKNYEKTKYCALTFLQNKPRELNAEHQKNQAHFHLIKSYFHLAEYRAAVQHFSKHDDEIVQSMPDAEYTELQVFLIQSYIQLNQTQQVQRHIESVQEMYRSKAWPYDALMARVDLSHAEFLYAQGQLKYAHQCLKRVLAFPEHNRKALIFQKTWKKPSFWQRLF